MDVPFLDLAAQYASIKEEIDASIHDVISSSAFAGGRFVERFESSFADYCGCSRAIGVASGTDALWMALLALGIGPGDEVITVPNTFIATAEAISLVGAVPVFVDVCPDTYTMNPALIGPALSKRTRAIIPVHLFGQTADMDPIMDIARQRKLFVIEDACQAHGAEYKGRRAGTIGDAGCYSFYPGKNLGAYGEAGAIVTNRSDIAERVRRFRDHGQKKKYFHEIVGWNGRMDGIQGAVLYTKLKYLDQWNQARRNNAHKYRQALSTVEGIVLPVEASYGKHVYHVFAIRAVNRDSLIEHMEASGVHCSIHYPLPIHLQEAYTILGLKKGAFPVSERCAEGFISLPMFPELKDDQIERVSMTIRELPLRHAQ